MDRVEVSSAMEFQKVVNNHMSNIFIWDNRLIIFFLLIVFSCCNSQTSTNSLSADTKQADTKYLDVCEITNNISLYNNKIVKIKGQFKGFHQLLLFSDDCPGKENIILLDIDYSYFLESTENTKVPTPNTKESNEIKGEIFLQGEVKKDSGIVFYYGKLITDTRTGKIIEKPEDIKVSRITNLKIDRFDLQ